MPHGAAYTSGSTCRKRGRWKDKEGSLIPPAVPVKLKSSGILTKENQHNGPWSTHLKRNMSSTTEFSGEKKVFVSWVLFENACYWFLITGSFLTLIIVRMCNLDSEFYILEFYISCKHRKW